MGIVGFCVNSCASDTEYVGRFSFYYVFEPRYYRVAYRFLAVYTALHNEQGQS